MFERVGRKLWEYLRKLEREILRENILAIECTEREREREEFNVPSGKISLHCEHVFGEICLPLALTASVVKEVFSALFVDNFLVNS